MKLGEQNTQGNSFPNNRQPENFISEEFHNLTRERVENTNQEDI